MPQKTPKLPIIDRFEGNWAVIEYGDKTFNFPKNFFPKKQKKAMYLSLILQ